MHSPGTQHAVPKIGAERRGGPLWARAETHADANNAFWKPTSASGCSNESDQRGHVGDTLSDSQEDLRWRIHASFRGLEEIPSAGTPFTLEVVNAAEPAIDFRLCPSSIAASKASVSSPVPCDGNAGAQGETSGPSSDSEAAQDARTQPAKLESEAPRAPQEAPGPGQARRMAALRCKAADATCGDVADASCSGRTGAQREAKERAKMIGEAGWGSDAI